MLGRHIDVVALLAIVFGMLAFAHIPAERPLFPQVSVVRFHPQTPGNRLSVCPFVKALIPRFR